jgi:hypothetical protein
MSDAELVETALPSIQFVAARDKELQMVEANTVFIELVVRWKVWATNEAQLEPRRGISQNHLRVPSGESYRLASSAANSDWYQDALSAASRTVKIATIWPVTLVPRLPVSPAELLVSNLRSFRRAAT